MKTKTKMALYFDDPNENDCQNNYDVQQHDIYICYEPCVVQISNNLSEKQYTC